MIGGATSKYLGGKSVPLKKSNKKRRIGNIKPKSVQQPRRKYDTTYKTP